MSVEERSNLNLSIEEEVWWVEWRDEKNPPFRLQKTRCDNEAAAYLEAKRRTAQLHTVQAIIKPDGTRIPWSLLEQLRD